MNTGRELLQNLDKLHTTALGVARIRRNLSLADGGVADFCRAKISCAHAVITRSGKNWYVNADNCIITINAHSYTIITAHKTKECCWYALGIRLCENAEAQE